MKLYEIELAIQEIMDGITVDEETGEAIGDFDALDALEMQREEIYESVILSIKNSKAEAEAIKAEEKALAERRKKLEKCAARTQAWIAEKLNGEKFKTSRCAVTFRTTPVAVIGEDFMAYALASRPDLLRYKEPEPDKVAIKKLLQSGEEITGCTLENSVSMTIK